MTSLSHYMERPGMLTHIMAHLFRLYNHFTIQNPFEAGKVSFDTDEDFDRAFGSCSSSAFS